MDRHINASIECVEKFAFCKSLSSAIAKMYECNELIISLNCTKSKHLKYDCSSRIQRAIDVTFDIEIQCLLTLVHVVDILFSNAYNTIRTYDASTVNRILYQPINCHFQLKAVLAITKIIYLLHISVYMYIYMLHNRIASFFSKIKFGN